MMNTRFEIDKVVWSTLREAGIVRPPVNCRVLLDHLELHRDFYDLQNPDFLDRTKHKIRIHGRKLVNIIRQIKLVAVLFYDEERIVVDADLPAIKREWPTLHEVSHKIFTWHRPFFDGDTAHTLEPDFQEELEPEANYGASALMFCGPIFKRDAQSTKPCWTTIRQLKKRYDKSLITTLRRCVEHGPDHAMAMLVSTPRWRPKPSDQPNRWRYFVTSPRFAAEFAGISAAQTLAVVDANSARRRGGPVADFVLDFCDDAGQSHEFRCES